MVAEVAARNIPMSPHHFATPSAALEVCHALLIAPAVRRLSKGSALLFWGVDVEDKGLKVRGYLPACLFPAAGFGGFLVTALRAFLR